MDQHFCRKIQRLHGMGARPLAEFLSELGNEIGAVNRIEAKVDRYLQIPDDALDLTGACNFPPTPIHEVA
jgi:hypothetical protein